MKIFALGPLYLTWHYTRGISDLFGVYKNIVWFLWRFFSIKELLKTFFSPFKRLKENYKGGLQLGDLMESFIVTTIMRFLGMILRAVVILLGLFFIIFSLPVFIVLVICWLILPALILFLFIVSLISLFK